MYFLAELNNGAYDSCAGPFDSVESAQKAQSNLKLPSFKFIILRFPKFAEAKAA